MKLKQYPLYTILISLLMTQPALAELSGSASTPPNISGGSSAFGSSGLQVTSELPKLVAGYSTTQVPKKTYYKPASGGGFTYQPAQYNISPPFKVTFRSDGTPILSLGAHIAVYYNGYRAFYAGNYALSKYGVADGGYRYCTGKRYMVGRLCIIARFDGVQFEPFFQSGTSFRRVYGYHPNLRRTQWYNYTPSKNASWTSK